MFSITLICMGKCKEKFYIAAAEEYAKRMKGYCEFKLLELPEYRLPENPSDAEIAQGLAKEAEAIKKAIPKGAWFCTLTPEGKLLSSEELAQTMKTVKSTGDFLEPAADKNALFWNMYGNHYHGYVSSNVSTKLHSYDEHVDYYTAMASQKALSLNEFVKEVMRLDYQQSVCLELIPSTYHQ